MELAVLWRRERELVPQLPLLHELHQGRLLSRSSAAPLPPGKSKQKSVRYLDVRENELDQDQFVEWIEQAAKLPGERM